jgi:hypothetical protein
MHEPGSTLKTLVRVLAEDSTVLDVAPNTNGGMLKVKALDTLGASEGTAVKDLAIWDRAQSTGTLGVDIEAIVAPGALTSDGIGGCAVGAGLDSLTVGRVEQVEAIETGNAVGIIKGEEGAVWNDDPKTAEGLNLDVTEVAVGTQVEGGVIDPTVKSVLVGDALSVEDEVVVGDAGSAVAGVGDVEGTLGVVEGDDASAGWGQSEAGHAEKTGVGDGVEVDAVAAVVGDALPSLGKVEAGLTKTAFWKGGVGTEKTVCT